ncbi:MAG: valS, partial [Modestobacter sp.]|nr:valS [Modestobacter sp.]
APAAQVALVEAVRQDLTNSGRIQSLTVVAGEGPLTVDVVLAETPEG